MTLLLLPPVKKRQYRRLQFLLISTLKLSPPHQGRVYLVATSFNLQQGTHCNQAHEGTVDIRLLYSRSSGKLSLTTHNFTRIPLHKGGKGIPHSQRRVGASPSFDLLKEL